MSLEYLQTIIERLQSSASVKNVYGEPVQAQGKTLIPVARVAYGFGGGGGKGECADGDGAGGGGGVTASPVGVVEVTPLATQFVPVNDTRRLAGAALLGFLFGAVWMRRRRR